MTDLYEPGHYASEWHEGELEALYHLFERPEWHRWAACRGMDPHLFFPERGAGGTTREAKAICHTCPVMYECREAALSRGETRGIWGGLSERQRRVERSATRTLRVDPMRPVTGHGSEAGYRRHQRLKEFACIACREAHDRYRNPTQVGINETRWANG